MVRACAAPRSLTRAAVFMAAARAGKWLLHPEMLRYLAGDGGHEIMQASIICLMKAQDDAANWPVLRTLATAPSSPLRAAAVSGLGRIRAVVALG